MFVKSMTVTAYDDIEVGQMMKHYSRTLGREEKTLSDSEAGFFRLLCNSSGVALRKHAMGGITL